MNTPTTRSTATLVVALASASAAFAVPTVQYVSGHTDVAVRTNGGELEFFFEHTGNTVLVDAEPGDLVDTLERTYVRVPSSSSAPRPSDPQWDFLGVGPNETIWFLPQSNVAGVPYFGVGAEELSVLDWVGPLQWTVESVDAPDGASFSIWQTTTGGQAAPFVVSADGTPDTFAVPVGSHSHYNWGFTAEGVYRVELTAVGERTGGGIAETSATLWFAVGDDTVIAPPCPGDATGDGAVTALDISVVLSNFGSTGIGRAEGDVTGDGAVTALDISAVLAVFGSTCD